MGRSDDPFPVSIFLIMRISTKILGYRKLEICVNYKKINVDHYNPFRNGNEGDGEDRQLQDIMTFAPLKMCSSILAT